MRRPSVSLLVAFWTGLLISGALPLAFWVWVVVLAGLVLAMLLVRKSRFSFSLFLACTVLLGCLRSPDARWNRVRTPDLGRTEEKFPCIVKVSVASPLAGCGEVVKVRIDSVRVGYPHLEGGHVFLKGPHTARPLGVGGAAVAFGTFYRPRPRLNPYGYDAALRYRREGVAGTVIAGALEERGGSPPYLARYRRRIACLISSVGDEASRGVLEALLLGKRTNLGPRVKDTMIRAGTYHVIAISGLHVGIVVLLVTSLVTAAGPPRGLRILLGVVCVLGYVLFTGARPSAQRAGAFFLLVSIVRYLEWKVDLPNCVCAAGIVLLVCSPHLAWDVGFKLSLGAVFGITVLMPDLRIVRVGGGTLSERLKRYVRLGMFASFSAQLATLPILLYHFGRVSLMGIAANLAVLPIVTLAVAAGLEASLLVFVWERLGLVFMKSASLLVTLLLDVTSLTTRWLDPVVFTGRPSTARILVYVIGVSYMGLLRPRLKGRWKLACLILLYAYLVFPLPSHSDSEMVLTFIHVGDGDACLVQCPQGGSMLIDTGQGGDYDAGRHAVLPLLALKGIKRVETVIITHSHNDHYGGLRSLAGNIRIGRVLVGTLDGEEGYLEVLRRCRERGIEVDVIGRGDTLRCGGALVEILHPSGAYLGGRVDDPNAQSVVLRLVYGKRRILFTGDLTPEVQRELVGLDCDLACDLLKAPHHGAPDGVDPAFAEACGADLAVISVGSRFASHPSPATIGLLEDTGLLVLVTRRDGAVTVSTDGKDLEVRTVLGGRVSLKGRSPHLLDAAGGS